MRSHRPIALAAAFAAATLAACGGSSTATGPAKISVRLVDAPSTAFDKVYVDVRAVEIWSAESGWITLPVKQDCDPTTPEVDCVVDLLHLTSGVHATLVDDAPLPPGTYGQMRLLLGSNNRVVFQEGGETVERPLTVPSGQQTGVKMTVKFEVQPGTTMDVYIDFDAHRSVFVHGAGRSGKYILRPTVRAYDKLETGSIRGRLTDEQSGAGLPGVTVTAQTLEDGVPTVVRGDTTDAEGYYELTLIRRDVAHHVVAQPVVPGTPAEGPATIVYEAKASEAKTITAAAPIAAWDAAFATVPRGTLNATLDLQDPLVPSVPVSLLVRTALDVGGSALVSLQVREVPVNVVGDPQLEAVADLPAGSYGVLAEREVDGARVPGPVQAAEVPADGAVSVTVPVL
jgi:hypothetical protein